MRRPLLLSGFMAAGKTTVGRRVAELAGVPFEDLDQVVESRTGMSVADVFRTLGEAGFRDLERRELDRALGVGAPRVVALGGGTLLSRETRLRALESATVVTLVAPPEVVLERVGASGGRPLLEGADPARRVHELLDARSAAYAEAHDHVSTAGVTVDEAARAVLNVWKRDPIAVAAGDRTYCVDVQAGCLGSLLPPTVAPATRLVLVTDTTVEALHGPAIREALRRSGEEPVNIVLPAGEQHKTPAALEHVWREALGAGADRKSWFLAFGGGVVTDVAGFAAATFLRGVSWVAVPTTLLAMVDASVGGKTAVDLDGVKNAVGAFWQPRHVLCDPELTRTEPERNLRSGLAEAVKAGLIGDPELLDALERHAEASRSRDPEWLSDVVRRAVAVKARIVSRDEREAGLRAQLNLGHTIGHALEAEGGFERYTHGEAVSLGLVAALRMGLAHGVTPPALVDRTTALLEQLGLPTRLGQAPLLSALDRVVYDKKRQGTYIHFVFVHAAGKVGIEPLKVDEVRDLGRAAALH